MLPATEFSPCQCDYQRRKSTLCTKQQAAHPHTGTQEDSGRGRWETRRLALAPFPPEEEEGARQPTVVVSVSVGALPTSDTERTRLAVEGSFQLVSYSFVAEFL